MLFAFLRLLTFCPHNFLVSTLFLLQSLTDGHSLPLSHLTSFGINKLT